MNIDEAIQHCLEVGKECTECGKEHLQLAEWLEELKLLRQHNAVLFDFIKKQINEFQSKPLYEDGTHRIIVSGKLIEEVKQVFIEKGYEF